MANEHLQTLLDAPLSSLPVLMRAQQANAARVQREVLLDIVRTAQDTEFGIIAADKNNNVYVSAGVDFTLYEGSEFTLSENL